MQIYIYIIFKGGTVLCQLGIVVRRLFEGSVYSRAAFNRGFTVSKNLEFDLNKGKLVRWFSIKIGLPQSHRNVIRR